MNNTNSTTNKLAHLQTTYCTTGKRFFELCFRSVTTRFTFEKSLCFSFCLFFQLNYFCETCPFLFFGRISYHAAQLILFHFIETLLAYQYTVIQNFLNSTLMVWCWRWTSWFLTILVLFNFLWYCKQANLHVIVKW